MLNSEATGGIYPKRRAQASSELLKVQKKQRDRHEFPSARFRGHRTTGGILKPPNHLYGAERSAAELRVLTVRWSSVRMWRGRLATLQAGRLQVCAM